MQSRHLTAEQLSARLDGQLSESEQRTVEAHLASCAACQRELEELRQTVALIRAVPAAVPPRSFRLFETGAPSRTASRPWALTAWLRAMGGAAATLMVVVWAADAMLPAAQLSPAASALQPSTTVSPTTERSLRSEPAAEKLQVQPSAAAALQSTADNAGVGVAPSGAGAPAGAGLPTQPEGLDAEQGARAVRTTPEPATPEPSTSDRAAFGGRREGVPLRPGQVGAIALGLLAAVLLAASLFIPRRVPRR